MKKGTGTLLAAVAAVALSGGAFAQTSGGMSSGSSSHGATANPATNQMNDTTSGYGMPGATNSDSGMSAPGSNMGQQPGMNNGATTATPAPKTNNTLATPSVKSPVGN
ncbi:MAG: hypothetical protein V4793_28885 [Paraburkholderia tropica]|uniref:hypothetical protein n=1 Tax=Paraburkholderia tropica TaxID=92647 RepID=UPI00310177FD